MGDVAAGTVSGRTSLGVELSYWHAAVLANGVVSVAYALISLTIFRALVRTGQLASNRLGLATALIFATCSAGHGYHVLHMLLPAVGFGAPELFAMRQAYDWHLVAVDSVTAAVGAWYWSLRRHYGKLLTGRPVLFEDIKARQRQALEINDNVVQGLAVAKYALAAGDGPAAREAIDRTLVSARELMGDLLGEEGTRSRLGPGDLTRAKAATVLTPAE